MKLSRFVELVSRYSGSSEEVARDASDATLRELGAMLTGSQRKALVEQLPKPLGESVEAREPEPTASHDVDEFYHDVEIDPEAEIGYQVEHAQSVCRALVDAVDEETLSRLQNHLPEGFHDLLESREIDEIQSMEPGMPAEEPGEAPRTVEKEDRKLSTGRPGPSNPINEAKGDAHSESVADTTEPHKDRKLATGSSAMNEGHDLATGRPDGKPVPPEDSEESEATETSADEADEPDDVDAE